MSAICCAVPSLMATGGSSSLPVVYPHHHFSRPSAPLHHQNSFAFMELNSQYQQQQQQQLPCHQPVDQFTSTVYGSSQQHPQQQQQQFLMPHQQAVASCQSRASRRKKFEDALTEVIPAASNGKVSQRIAQLQQSLYASCHPGHRMIQPPQQQQQHPSTSRPLSLDPLKDYCQPLTVDCSIEYDLPRVTRPPPGAKPLLLIARRPPPPPPPPTLPAVNQSPPQRQQWNPVIRTAHHQILMQQQQQQQQTSQQQFQFRPDCGYFVMNIAPVSSSSSEDSGRGTDSEQHPSASSPVYHTAVHPAANNNWMSEPQWSLIRQQQQQLKFNQQHVKLQHPRPAEAARARVSMTTEQSGCHCCPSRSNPFPAQRWAPYNTQTSSMMAARHGCPAPASVVFQQQQQQQESWTRWNDSSVSLDQLILQTTPHYNNNNNNNHPSSSSSSSLMAFHI